MPVFNGERFLSEAINSILAQTFADFELLVMDDGSTDGSLAIARSYTDPRLRIISEAHYGLVSTLNRGICESRGEYIARMDADDISDPQRFERQIACLDAQHSTVMVGCRARIINAAGHLISDYPAPPVEGRGLVLSLYRSNPFVHGSVMLRRKPVASVGGYRTAFLTTEDYDLWLRLSEIGWLVNLPLYLYSFRVHQNAKTAHEGRGLMDRYHARAQRFALQRRLFGYDSLGHSKINGEQVGRKVWQGIRPAASTVSLLDWSHIFLAQGQVRLAFEICRQVQAAQKGHVRCALTAFRCYWSRASIQALLITMRRIDKVVRARTP